MEYKKIRDVFYLSKFISKIPDNWKEGLPFLKIINKKVFDVILFYMDDSKNSIFYEAEAMYIIDSISGEICFVGKEELAEQYQLEKNFAYDSNLDSMTVDEVLQLKSEMIDRYEIIRDTLISGNTVDAEIYYRYNELFRLLAPVQIIEKIYTPLITK